MVAALDYNGGMKKLGTALLCVAWLGCGSSSSGDGTDAGPSADSTVNGDVGADAGVGDAGVDAGGSEASAEAAAEAATDATIDVTAESGTDAAAETIADALPDGEASLIAARPYSSHAPKGYDGSTPTPMILLLHGYGATGIVQMGYFGFAAMSDDKGVFIAYPDGTKDSAGKLFWNATDACCDLDGKAVDDVAYLTAVVHDMQARFNIDPKRIWVVGHSNGAFMTQRLACERSDLFAAGVSLAGAQWLDQTKCTPTRPFPIADVHGDADATISYTGGTVTQTNGTMVAFPGELTTVGDWATHDGCTSALTDTGVTKDLDSSLAGAETSVSSYTGCNGAGAVELWTIHGGAHVPTLITADGGASPTWGQNVYGFLSLHPMP